MCCLRGTNWILKYNSGQFHFQRGNVHVILVVKSGYIRDTINAISAILEIKYCSERCTFISMHEVSASCRLVVHLALAMSDFSWDRKERKRRKPNIQPPGVWNIPKNDLWHLSPTFASGSNILKLFRFVAPLLPFILASLCTVPTNALHRPRSSLLGTEKRRLAKFQWILYLGQK